MRKEPDTSVYMNGHGDLDRIQEESQLLESDSSIHDIGKKWKKEKIEQGWSKDEARKAWGKMRRELMRNEKEKMEKENKLKERLKTEKIQEGADADDETRKMQMMEEEEYDEQFGVDATRAKLAAAADEQEKEFEKEQ